MNNLPSWIITKLYSGIQNKSSMRYLLCKFGSNCDYRYVSDKIERDRKILENNNTDDLLKMIKNILDINHELQLQIRSEMDRGNGKKISKIYKSSIKSKSAKSSMNVLLYPCNTYKDYNLMKEEYREYTNCDDEDTKFDFEEFLLFVISQLKLKIGEPVANNFEGISETYNIMFVLSQLILKIRCDVNNPKRKKRNRDPPVDSYIYDIFLNNYLLTYKSIISYMLYFFRCLHVYKFIEQMRVIMNNLANVDADFHIRLNKVIIIGYLIIVK